MCVYIGREIDRHIDRYIKEEYTRIAYGLLWLTDTVEPDVAAHLK